MINIEIRSGKREYDVCVRGHAGYAELGKDIVCAGVSSLILAFAVFAEEYDGCVSDIEMASGKADIKVHFKRRSPRLKGACELFESGLLLIANEHPENVRVSVIVKS